MHTIIADEEDGDGSLGALEHVGRGNAVKGAEITRVIRLTDESRARRGEKEQHEFR